MMMKRPISLLLILVISILISSCSFKVINSTKPEEKTILSSYEETDKLPQQYGPELAQKNGDVVGVHGKSYNIGKLEKFIEEFKNKKSDVSDMVRVTTYTNEGDAIIFDLILSGGDIKLVVDNTRDNFAGTGNRKKKEYKVKDILKQNKDEGILYSAKTDKSEEIHLIFVNGK
jgi:predicted GTPase